MTTSLRHFSKIFLVAFIPIAFSLLTFFLIRSFYAPPGGSQAEVLLQSPYQRTNWQGFGQVFEPLVEMSLVYPDDTRHRTTFLLDSGALISSLPREDAPLMGYQSLAQLQRSTFVGFGGQRSFAYRGEMAVWLGEEKVTIPVVFTDAVGTKRLLGRAGFMENYSIYFNSEKEQIEIREK